MHQFGLKTNTNIPQRFPEEQIIIITRLQHRSD